MVGPVSFGIIREEDINWQARGTCYQKMNLQNMFFSETNPIMRLQARYMCEQCPVRKECRDYAIRHSIQYGIWGGLTPHERRRYKRIYN